MQKILKNTTASDIELQVIGITVAANSSSTIHSTDFAILASEDSINELTSLINSGDIVVNDGNNDLTSEVGIAHVETGVAFKHEDIHLSPILGENPAEIVVVNSCIPGYKMEVGDIIYGQTRIDRLVGDKVEFQIHMAVDNTTADRWVQFEVKYFTSNGRDDLKQIDTIDGTVNSEQKEIPTTAYAMFETVVDIPSTAFNSDENYLFVCVERITPAGKTSPTENPIILRYCKRYYESFQ
jgi:hypothetical protein